MKGMSGWQRWALMSDSQCGAWTGLTSRLDEVRADTEHRQQLKTMGWLFQSYQDAIEWLGRPVDRLLHCGDALHGRDPLGRDVWDDDPFRQAEDSAELMAMVPVRREHILLTGTRYHTNIKSYSFEWHVAKALQNILARRRRKSVRVTVVRKLNTSINGWFHLEARHKIERSVIPHGRKTAQERAKVWNVMNAAVRSSRSGRPATWPDLSLFGHVHYWSYAEDAFGATMILPSWQGLGGRHGDEECSGRVDVGMVRLEVGPTEEDGWRWDKKLYEAAAVRRVERR